MGTNNAITIRALNVRAKVSLVTVLALLISLFIAHGLISPNSADAAISQQANWTSQYAAVAYPAGAVNANYTIAAGTNRLLVVAIASTRTTVGTQTVSNVTYGGKALTLAAGDGASTSTWNHSYLYYLKETGIQGASGTSLNVTISGGTQYYTYVYAAVYAGVDQTTPFTDAKNFNSATNWNTTVGPFSPTLAIAANDQAIEIVNLARSTSGTAATAISTWASGWTTANIAPSPITTNGPCAQLYIRDRNILTSANDGSQHTANGNSWDSMTAMSIKPAWPKVATFTAPTPSTSRDIPITAFTADASVPVTDYIITTSSTPPASGAAGWTGTALATYTVGADGSFTLYPWVKNGTEVSTVFATPATVVVDTVKPTVSTTVPANSATNVTLNSSITINWSEPVNCNTVTTGNITVSGGTLTRTSCSASQAVFSVSGQAYSTAYTVTVGTGVTDANGNAMNAAYPFSYTTQNDPNPTVVGTATATATSGSTIAVSMTYTLDGNANNTYTIDYKLTSEPTVWTNWVTADTHIASPYTNTITGLSPVTSYDVRVTWNDVDGVTGTNPQTITGITTPRWNMVGDQATSPITTTYTAPDGLFRAMVVAVTTEYSCSGGSINSGITTAATFGGTAMTKAVSDDATSNRVHTALFYLTDSQIPAGSQTINISATTPTCSFGTPTLVNMTAYAATFTGVNQATPITNSRNYNRTAAATTAVAFGTALTVNANDQAVYVSNIYNTASSTIPTYTISANWTSQKIDTGTSGTTAWKTEVSNRAIPGSNTTDNASTSTISPTSLASMSGMSLAYVGACVRNNPTVAITPATRKIIPGASVNYTVSVTNNDTGGCTPTTFSLSKTDNPTGFPTANFSNSVLSSATVGPIAVGATQTVTLTHTATDEAVTAATEVTSVTAAAANHSNVTSTSVTSTVAVSNGKFLYNKNTTTTQFRIYNSTSNTFDIETATNSLPNEVPTFMVDKSCPTRNEHIAGYVSSTGVLYIMRWDGSEWFNEWNVSVGGNGIDGRRFDIAYDNRFNQAMVVYSTNNTASGGDKLAYRTWDGTVWSDPVLITTARSSQTAAMSWVKLKPNPAASLSYQIALVACDTGTTTANTALLTGFIWDGSVWTEAGTAFTNGTYGYLPNSTAPAIQNDLFDLAFESLSGDLLVVYTTAGGTTPNQYYRTYSAGTWGTPTTFGGTARTAPLQMVAESDPQSDKILVMWSRNTTTTVYANVWSGTAVGTTTTVSNSNVAAPATNKKQIAAKWLVYGGTSYAIPLWATNTAGTIGYAYYTGTTWTAGTSGFTYNTGTGASANWMDTTVNPKSADTMMLTFSTGAAGTGSLWAKRLQITNATPTFAWTNADGGSALTTALASATSQNFSFEYDRTKTLLTEGVAANPADVCPGATSQKLHGFSLSTTTSIDSVTALTVTTTNQAAIASMEIWNEAGTTKYFGTVNNPGSDTWAFSGGTPIPVTPTPSNYKIVVTYNTHGTAPVANTATTATVTAYTCTNSKYGVDHAEAIITLDNAVASNAAWEATSGGTGTATLDWNKGSAGDNVLIVRFAANTDGTMPTEGTAYVANTAYGVGGTVVYAGSATTITDDNNGALLAGGTYYYRIFEYDGCNNYATSAPWTSGVVVSSPYPTVAGTATATPASTSSIAVSMPYAGDTNTNNTLKVEYKLTADSTWTTWSGPDTHPASPYTSTITGLTGGQSYDVKCTYTDANGIIGTDIQTITPIVLPMNSTTAGAPAASVLDPTTILVSMPYTDDYNANNTYTVQWKLDTDGSYPPANKIDGSHSASPFTTQITGLLAETSYDVLLTWNDPDGVIGSPQTILGIVTPYPFTNMNLVHNSTNASNPLNANSIKWAASGGWGLSGTKYGSFSCSTCHIPKTSNIFRIKTGITVPDTSKGNIPGASNTVNFQSRTLTNTYGNYSAPIGGYSNSQRICETCHSATSYHKYTQTKIHHEEDAGLKDCIVCHEHNKGFKPIGACTICHARPQGNRNAVMGQFTTSGSSHHIQGVKVTDQLCYQCHWEANIDGTVNTAYHGGSLNPGAPVRLVRYKNGLRPTVYKDMTSAVLYTANGSRTEFQKINNHCLGCHSAPSNSAQPFGDGKSPKQYAWDGKSIDERYSQTGTTPWGKYSDTATTNVSPKDTQIKAFSAHGNASVNKRGWNLTETWPNTSGTVNVLCYDCHNSHGSAASGVTSNYSSATGRNNGAILKSTTAGKGGYTVTYKPQSGGSAGTKDVYNPGAGICFDCHNTQNPSAQPWDFQATYGASQAIVGYRDTPDFSSGTFPSSLRYPYKAANGTNKGGHFGKSSAMTTTPSSSINGLCTPCHDPHGVSPTLGANQQYAVPLLKGTWLTSPYPEDAAPLNKTETRGGSTSRGPSSINVGSTPLYHIDQNTFGAQTNNSRSSGNPPSWNFNNTTNRITQTDTQFAGLCLQCHPKSSIGPGTTDVTTNWKSMDRVHNTVKGWGTFGGNNANAAHSFTCSKCHTPHNAKLPRLMVTNCLDFKHRGQVASGGTFGSGALSQYRGAGGGRGPMGGGGNGSSPDYYGPWFFGNTNQSQTSNIRTCHNVVNAGGTGTAAANELWNTKTPW